MAVVFCTALLKLPHVGCRRVSVDRQFKPRPIRPKLTAITVGTVARGHKGGASMQGMAIPAAIFEMEIQSPPPISASSPHCLSDNPKNDLKSLYRFVTSVIVCSVMYDSNEYVLLSKLSVNSSQKQ